jgi:hypothetical protein
LGPNLRDASEPDDSLGSQRVSESGVGRDGQAQLEHLVDERPDQRQLRLEQGLEELHDVAGFVLVLKIEIG